MHEAVAAALATEGLIWLAAAVLAAGLVRGFSGFGSAMIMMPIATLVLSPFGALAFLAVIELVGPLPNLRAALRDGSPGDVALLLAGAALTLPVGLWLLSGIDPRIFGWLVSVVVLGLLGLLSAGWRYSGTVGPRTIFGIGGLGGALAGLSGLPGPPVIMFYMASRLPVSVIRANFLLYLLGVDVLLLSVFWMGGLFDVRAVAVAVLLMLPYIAANALGALLFQPRRERIFRLVAYLIIGASAILGLPVWSG